jgi:thiol-disulfide isomerase/thioredoxin
MNQRAAIIGLLVFVLAAFGGLVFYDAKYGHKFDKLLGKDKTTQQNWKWDDQWDSKGPNVQVPPVNPNPPAPTPPPTPPVQQLIAGSYQEAIQKSGELGRPVLVIFTAEWCSWCKKMKSETMTDSRVQSVLKNYILVYVDTDKDRSPVRKFGVESLPSFVITNVNEEKLKFDSGFKNADSFASWLNSPNLFQQPKRQQAQPQQPPQPTQPQDNRKRPFQRNTPPQPTNPNLNPAGPNC